MHKSVYDVLHKKYTLHRKLPPEQEALAQAIITSGKMRLDADTESNFVRLLVPEERIDITISMRELNTPNLRALLQSRLLAMLSKRHNNAAARTLVTNYLEKATQDMARRHPVKPRTETMMARALVLCNELPVIRLIHLEGAEIFISFGQSVGEVMDVARWEQAGENSGLQAAGGGENAVYVSCGGHPFLEEKEFRHSGDGSAALARFMIIAAQETGHNGDMVRGANGQWIGRYSATDWQREPSPKAGAGRLADIATTEHTWSECQRLGLNRIAEWERHLQFYRKMEVRSWRSVFVWCSTKLGWQLFRLLMKKRSHSALPRLQRDIYPCMLLQTFFSDMLANLDPQADVYRRNNPREEEAVACIEAVARVPQQVVKWGHQAVRITTPALYAFYYGEIVSACEKAARAMLQRSKNGE